MKKIPTAEELLGELAVSDFAKKYNNGELH
jgi:hypothetical protein